MTPRAIAATDLALREHIRAGDTVVWGQACAEPRTLVELLVRQRAELGGVRCFLGIPAAGTVRAAHADHLRLVSYCGTGGNSVLFDAGVLDIYPGHYSTLPWLVSRGPLAADVVLVQVAPADAQGRYSLGFADDYLSAAIDSARVVIAEVNDQVPFVYGSRYLSDDDLDVVVPTSRPPAELPGAELDETTRRIASQVAELVEDGATLQFGIGAIPAAVLSALADHRDLGIHSGVLDDAAADLIERGVITNGRKSIDSGVAIATTLLGTRRLFALADRSPAVGLRPITYTHDPEILAAQHKFVAINSAVEVDLTGQINAELAGGRYVGAVGGAADFLRGAARSPGGLPVVALPATAGPRSRIVARLNGPVSTSRADAGVIVTEFGVADLRGRTLRERRAAMLAIAHPDHRAALENSL